MSVAYHYLSNVLHFVARSPNTPVSPSFTETVAWQAPRSPRQEKCALTVLKGISALSGNTVSHAGQGSTSPVVPKFSPATPRPTPCEATTAPLPTPGLLTGGQTLSSVECSAASVIPLRNFSAVHLAASPVSSSTINGSVEVSETARDTPIRCNQTPSLQSGRLLIRTTRTRRGLPRRREHSAPAALLSASFERVPIEPLLSDYQPRPFLTNGRAPWELASSLPSLCCDGDDLHTPRTCLGFQSPSTAFFSPTDDPAEASLSQSSDGAGPSVDAREDTPFYVTIYNVRPRLSDEQMAYCLLATASQMSAAGNLDVYMRNTESYTVW